MTEIMDKMELTYKDECREEYTYKERINFIDALNTELEDYSKFEISYNYHAETDIQLSAVYIEITYATPDEGISTLIYDETVTYMRFDDRWLKYVYDTIDDIFEIIAKMTNKMRNDFRVGNAVTTWIATKYFDSIVVDGEFNKATKNWITESFSEK